MLLTHRVLCIRTSKERRCIGNPSGPAAFLFFFALLFLSSCEIADTPTCADFTRVASFDGTELAAKCSGQRASPTLVFIHGWSQSMNVWTPQATRLSDDHRILMYDVRGHGASDRPTEAEAYNGRWTHARDVKAVFDAFNVKDCAFLIGWSFGAIIAADTAVHMGPERVCGLVLVSGTPDTGAGANHFGPLMAATSALTAGPTSKEEQDAVNLFLNGSYVNGTWDEGLFDQIYQDNLLLSPDDRRLVAQRPAYSNIAALNDAEIPVLLIHGSQDPVLQPSSSEQAAAAISLADLVLYEGTGHWPFLEQADRFEQDIRSFVQGRANQ